MPGCRTPRNSGSRRVCASNDRGDEGHVGHRHQAHGAGLKGRVDLAAFHDAPLDDPALMALTAKTSVLDDPHSDYPLHFPGEVIVHLRDGRTFRCRKPASYDSPHWAMARDAVMAKFLGSATRAIEPAAAERLAGFVLSLEATPSLDELVELCVGVS